MNPDTLTRDLLEMMFNLIRRVSCKEPGTRFVVVVISDGGANQGMTDLSAKDEVARCAQLLLEPKHTDYLVVDTEDKSGFMRTDLAAGLASLLRFNPNDLKSSPFGSAKSWF